MMVLRNIKYKTRQIIKNLKWKLVLHSSRDWEVEIMIMPPAIQGEAVLKGGTQGGGTAQLYGPTMIPAVLHVSIKQKHMEVFKKTHLHLV